MLGALIGGDDADERGRSGGEGRAPLKFGLRGFGMWLDKTLYTVSVLPQKVLHQVQVLVSMMERGAATPASSSDADARQQESDAKLLLEMQPRAPAERPQRFAREAGAGGPGIEGIEGKMGGGLIRDGEEYAGDSSETSEDKGEIDALAKKNAPRVGMDPPEVSPHL